MPCLTVKATTLKATKMAAKRPKKCPFKLDFWLSDWLKGVTMSLSRVWIQKRIRVAYLPWLTIKVTTLKATKMAAIRPKKCPFKLDFG